MATKGPESDVSEPEQLPPLDFERRPYGLTLHTYYRIKYGIAHATGLYFLLYLVPFGYVSPWSLILLSAWSSIIGLGITVGAHRYWTHKTFKANKALQILLMMLQTAVHHGSIYHWCRNHRVHHKYTDTDADPHNSKRGFMFSHILWLVSPPHPELIKASRVVQVKDLEMDPIVRFQCIHYHKLVFIFTYLIPMTTLKLLYPEWSILTIVSANYLIHIMNSHGTFLVNSAAHMWGYKPYDKYITSVENSILSIIVHGEGYHNYHHTFPWDYKASESGLKFNFSTLVINFFAKIGWAWDLKTVNQTMLIDRINRTGDGHHPLFDASNTNQKVGKTENDFKQSLAWGWGDKDIAKEQIEITDTLFKKDDCREL